MLIISYVGCLGLSLAIWVQFTLEVRVAAQNCEKIHQNLLLWGLKVIQGHRCWHF